MALRPTRRQFAAALAGLAAPRYASAQTKPPNILLVVANELRADTLGSMGHPVVKTPVLDTLARGGALLRNLFAASADATPARVSLLSGRYPGQHGATAADRPAAPETPFLPRLLAKAGYRTGMVGKAGFVGAADLFESRAAIPDDYVAHLREQYPGTEPEILKLANEPSGQRHAPWRVGASIYPAQDSTVGWTTARALDFVREDSKAPWFLMVAYDQPSHPYVLPYPWPTRYPREQISISPLPGERPTPPCSPDDAERYIVAGMEGALIEVRQHYFGAVAFLDEQLGLLTSELRSKQVLDETIFVFTADRGNMLGDLGRMFDRVPYDGALRVPGIVRYPRVIPAARRIGNVLDATSLVPTLLDAAGIGGGPEFDAPSAKALLAGESADWDDIAFGETGFRWARTSRYKLVEPGDHPSWTGEFYDLANDPGETKNLHDAPAAAAARRELEARLQGWSTGGRRG